MTEPLTEKEKSALRNYWKATYAAVRIRKNGVVDAKKTIFQAWGVLQGPSEAKETALFLIARDAERKKASKA